MRTTKSRIVYSGFLWVVMIGTYTQSAFSNDIQFEQLSDGYTAVYSQADPFDNSIREYIYFRKDNFTFNCDAISFEDPYNWITYDSFSFPATVALKIDAGPKHELAGTYSTYLFGSDMVNDDRVYAADMTPNIVEELKRGDKLQASGKFGDSGWEAYTLDLSGFSAAYDEVCSN